MAQCGGSCLGHWGWGLLVNRHHRGILKGGAEISSRGRFYVSPPSAGKRGTVSQWGGLVAGREAGGHKCGRLSRRCSSKLEREKPSPHGGIVRAPLAPRKGRVRSRQCQQTALCCLVKVWNTRRTGHLESLRKLVEPFGAAHRVRPAVEEHGSDLRGSWLWATGEAPQDSNRASHALGEEGAGREVSL